MNPILIFLSLILVGWKTSDALNLPPIFPAILIFGDSAVDTGNNNYIPTMVKSNHSPYGQDFPNGTATGRFSNGLLVPDLLASSFGIKEFVPPYFDPSLSDNELPTGVSFASAGSGLDELSAKTSGALSMPVQISLFKNYKEDLVNVVGKEEASKIVSGAFVMIDAGGNDILFNFYDTQARRRSQFNITEYHNFLLQKQKSLVKELYDLGCRIFGVSGVAPLGCIPFQITRKNSKGRRCLEAENAETQMYNSKLKNMTQILQETLLGSSIAYLDNYNPMMDMINNQQKYGFVETNRGCCGTGLTEIGPFCNATTPVCSNPSEYLFWDAVHPSEAVYKSIAKTIYRELLETN
ncbi:hypothetical protein MKW94_004981 [Papaver nudicaule]|uniref:GDSL esterase/lipase n=1 Tax=Papaver nudicaule TaxID=74823 RepID=A0AA41RMA9_PAPNU|nr:hypothetical protein [Papaver nudicaule]